MWPQHCLVEPQLVMLSSVTFMYMYDHTHSFVISCKGMVICDHNHCHVWLQTLSCVTADTVMCNCRHSHVWPWWPQSLSCVTADTVMCDHDDHNHCHVWPQALHVSMQTLLCVTTTVVMCDCRQYQCVQKFCCMWQYGLAPIKTSDRAPALSGGMLKKNS